MQDMPRDKQKCTDTPRYATYGQILPDTPRCTKYAWINPDMPDISRNAKICPDTGYARYAQR
jgi:hypothetical protein